jgi:hypothetical protein
MPPLMALYLGINLGANCSKISKAHPLPTSVDTNLHLNNPQMFLFQLWSLTLSLVPLCNVRFFTSQWGFLDLTYLVIIVVHVMVLPFNFSRCKGIKILKLSMPWTDGSYIELETIELGTSQFRKLELMTGFVFWRNKLTQILIQAILFIKKITPKLDSFSNTGYHWSCIKGPKLIELATVACLRGGPCYWIPTHPRTSPIVKHKVNVYYESKHTDNTRPRV